MAAITEPNRLHDVVKYEEELRLSREKVTILAGRVIPLGAVVAKGKRSLGTPATGTNAGDGALTGVALGAKAKIGTYTLTCVAEAVGGGVFSMVDPDGFRLADAVVGAPYQNEALAFSLGAGDSDFQAGDSFTIPVEAGDRKVVQLDPTAADGSEQACGVTIAEYDATEGDVAGVIIARNAIIVASGLAWPEGIDADGKTKALDDLAALGIITREEA